MIAKRLNASIALTRPTTHRRNLSLFRPLSRVVAAVLLACVVLAAAVVPSLPSSDPFSQNLSARVRPPFYVDDDGTMHLLGTDVLGRDLLSRLTLAGRYSLLIAGSAVSLSLIVGTLLGLVAGYIRGWLSMVIMSLADIQLAVPRVLLLIAVVAVVGSSLPNLIVVLGLTSWVPYARVIRAQVLSLRDREFVLAARSIGAAPSRIALYHVLPNAFGPALVIASFEFGQIILLEASLSFLGLGVQPPAPSWGNMIAEGQKYLQTAPWLTILPGLAIFMVVAGVNFLSRAFTAERYVSGL